MAVVDDVIYSIACSGPAIGIYPIGKTGINCVAVTPSNLAATQTKIAALATALNALTLGVLINDNLTIGISIGTGGPTGTANRGSKWIVSAQETSGDLNKFTYTIPAGDPSHAVAGTNSYDPTAAAWTNFITAFNAIAVSPAGTTLNFTGAKLGGRRR